MHTAEGIKARWTAFVNRRMGERIRLQKVLRASKVEMILPDWAVIRILLTGKQTEWILKDCYNRMREEFYADNPDLRGEVGIIINRITEQEYNAIMREAYANKR